ncbi:hypothetical protein BHM03_00053264 [Ensete ventricosum]|uniref:Uncharacterized protein n=1 Tax=Ensete ventricosum TaxID=4639 RepID=A0A445MLZ2_ENSVE|nr:hypothetical protein BHM03_00053264 [Ensete ventricosum]
MVPRNAECSPPNLLLLSPAYCCCCHPCSSTRCFPEAGPAIDCFPVATFPSVTPPLLSSIPVAPTLMMPSAKCKEREREFPVVPGRRRPTLPNPSFAHDNEHNYSGLRTAVACARGNGTGDQLAHSLSKEKRWRRHMIMS